MNATACDHVAQFVLNYTSENFSNLCAQRQNSKTINHMEKIKLLLNLQNNTLWIKKKTSSLEQIIRETQANECSSI